MPCIWLTGRRGAGKRTLGALAAATLTADGRRCAVLGPDDLATHLRSGPSEEGLASVAWLANLLTANGVAVIVTVDTPRRADRAAVAARIAGYVEILVDAPPEVCTQRAGRADPAYEEPIAPDHRVPTGDRDERAATALLVSYLEDLTDRD